MTSIKVCGHPLVAQIVVAEKGEKNGAAAHCPAGIDAVAHPLNR